MLFPNNISVLTGRLLSWPDHKVIPRDLLRSERLTFVRMIKSSRWEELLYESKVPLHSEDVTQDSGPYKYIVVCRRSSSRLLILSEHSEIVEHLLNNEFREIFTPHLRAVGIEIDPFVKSLAKTQGIYALSYAYAHVPGELSNLKSLAFYGDDLGLSTVFCDLLSELVFTNCGLRLAARGKEIVRLTKEGGVSFFPTNRQRLDEVETILGFLRDGGYLSQMTFKYSEVNDGR